MITILQTGLLSLEALNVQSYVQFDVMSLTASGMVLNSLIRSAVLHVDSYRS